MPAGSAFGRDGESGAGGPPERHGPRRARRPATGSAASTCTTPWPPGATWTVRHDQRAARRHRGRPGVGDRQPPAQLRHPYREDHQGRAGSPSPSTCSTARLVSNGAVAVVVTSVDRARGSGRTTGARLWLAPGPSRQHLAGDSNRSGDRCCDFRPSRHGHGRHQPRRCDVCQIYDCYTYTDAGHAGGRRLLRQGRRWLTQAARWPRRVVPTNTGGGQLSAYYMWGMTPLSEAVIQARGQGGERQVARHDVVLVSGNGGILESPQHLLPPSSARRRSPARRRQAARPSPGQADAAPAAQPVRRSDP